MVSIFSRGFRGKRQSPDVSRRLPPGQYLTERFPVLSAGPTPHTSLKVWDFSVVGSNGNSKSWNWEEFRALPRETITTDIHCVTRWSKFDTVWEGVSLDTLLEGLEGTGSHIMAFCDGGYTANLPIEDVTGGKAWIADTFNNEPLDPEHGGPARLLVPHLYFWKSAKWVRGIRLMNHDEGGFWENYGYHMYGDPWKEQRFRGD
ncbi:MAG: sulfite oxidase-like oxidoreductase [Nitrolancea sp.]